MLRKKADWVRRKLLWLNQLAPETRVASSLSSVEIFTSLYYGDVLHFDANDPFSDERDRCIISKGHGSICMYPILADLGFFAKEELTKICQEDSFLGGIPDPVIPGYETMNGSLGHGLGVGCGIALALKKRGSDRSVFVVCGDGELHEGSNWEAIMFAAHHRLDNLNLIIDNNSICMLGFTDDVVSHDGFLERFTAFGWSVNGVSGHDTDLLVTDLRQMKQSKDSKPKVLVADTVKGRGVSNLENQPLSHVFAADQNEVSQLLEGWEDG